MAIRVLQFDGDNDEHRTLTRMLYNGFIIGGDTLYNPGAGRTRTREERRVVKEITSKLKATWKDPKGAAIELADAGGTVELTTPQHELLTKYLDACPWGTSECGAATDLQDFVADAREKREP